MRFAKPSDLTVPAAPGAITSSTAVDAQYPLANLHSGNPIDPCRWVTGDVARVVWDLGAGSPPPTQEGLLVVAHNLYEGATLTVQANAANAWGAPSFSQNVTIPAYQGDWPPNVLLDLRATTVATDGYRFLSLLLPDRGSPATGHSVGEVCWVSEWTAPSVSCGWPVRRADLRRINVNSTAYGVDHVIDRGVFQRRLWPTFTALSDADRALWLALVREAGASLGWPMVLDVDATTDFAATAEGLFVRFHPDALQSLQEELITFGATNLSLDLLEVQRGLPL